MSRIEGRPIGLDAPHHDGSELYVSSSQPRLGERVRLRVRVPHTCGFTRVLVRTVLDGEHRFLETVAEARTEAETWWCGELEIVHPVTTYRFVLEGGPHQFGVLNGAGLWSRDVPDDGDFRITVHPPSPPWARDGVVYQIFPDRFARSAAADAREAPDWAVPAGWSDPVDTRRGIIGTQFYGGDLDGIVEHLDHLERLGVDVIYLTPFFPARSNHRYDASRFDIVDPLLGGGEAFERLRVAASARGMRLVGDITTNHTGAGHDWFTTAEADSGAATREYYFIGPDGGYASWLGVPSLPKLNWNSPALREAFCDSETGVIPRWIRAGLSGWRVDVANMTGRFGDEDHNHDVARWVRAAAGQDAVVVGEHVHDYTRDLVGDGWTGVMNYSGFAKPVWAWLRQHGREAGFLGAPVVVPELPAEQVVATMLDFTSRVSWSGLTGSWNLLGSHDTTRVRTLVGADSRRVDAAVGLLMTMPSTPMLTYGDEIGMEGAFGEDGRRPMPWSEDAWDSRLLSVYEQLIALRRESVALRRGGLRFLHAEGDAIVFLREHPQECALVHVSRAAHPPVSIETAAVPGLGAAGVAYGREVEISEGKLVLDADGPGVRVLTWASDPGTQPNWGGA
ncbi:MAG: glycoside hydrolase family 13 protein [Actinomycetia bacterium]|nr:glycoside hydrolase family 13 protein [Actinomycetes bacterium]